MIQNIELVPAKSIQPWVECIWAIRANGQAAIPGTARLLPDATVELITCLDGNISVRRGHDPLETPLRACIVGQLRSPLTISWDGKLDLLGVRFRPTGAATLLGAPMSNLTDRLTPTDDVLQQFPTQQLADVCDTNARLALVEQWLCERFANHTAFCPAHRATEAVLATGGTATVTELADDCGLSERQLERRFRDQVGLSPKALLRTVRFSRAVNRARDAASMDWSRLAIESGYCDQGHLCRDFAAIAGSSPQQLLSSSVKSPSWCSELDGHRFLPNMSGLSNTLRRRCA